VTDKQGYQAHFCTESISRSLCPVKTIGKVEERWNLDKGQGTKDGLSGNRAIQQGQITSVIAVAQSASRADGDPNQVFRLPYVAYSPNRDALEG
jgi:hypothetical protein